MEEKISQYMNPVMEHYECEGQLTLFDYLDEIQFNKEDRNLADKDEIEKI